MFFLSGSALLACASPHMLLRHELENPLVMTDADALKENPARERPTDSVLEMPPTPVAAWIP